MACLLRFSPAHRSSVFSLETCLSPTRRSIATAPRPRARARTPLLCDRVFGRPTTVLTSLTPLLASYHYRSATVSRPPLRQPSSTLPPSKAAAAAAAFPSLPTPPPTGLQKARTAALIDGRRPFLEQLAARAGPPAAVLAIAPFYTCMGVTLPTAVWGTLAVYATVFALWRWGPKEAQFFMYNHFLDSFDHTARRRRWHVLVTSAVSHVDVFHLAFSCMLLASLAPPLMMGATPVMSQTEYLAFYAAAAVFSGYVGRRLHVLTSRGFEGKQRALATPALGASGVLCALFTISAGLYPDQMWMVFPIPFSFSAAQLMVFLPLFDTCGLIYNRYSARGSFLAHGAHLAGYLFGLLILYFIVKPRAEKRKFRRWDNLRR